jgi:hypothetical protein
MLGVGGITCLVGVWCVCVTLMDSHSDMVHDIPVVASAFAMSAFMMSMTVQFIRGIYCLSCSGGI